ncbi:MAG: YchJ family protein [Spirochaetales bacterium]|uniref:YchJ family protein n=1 Tax=Candidatus Thalassospirochaeta sargassi TaxID=3119039 RepID=A0AAJ1MK24_9SPIO|nr:YchJ family protein [Spirochaetales bacterium]
MEKCPCGSGKTYAECCEPYVRGKKLAPGPEELMRSRYTAYVKQEIDYIVDTHNPVRIHRLDRDATEKWAAESEWLGLEIMRTETNGDEGVVEFVAKFKQDGVEYDHHEVSNFVKTDDEWFFDDGYTPSATVVRDSPKVGRNDPCPCGSGKKYKKCCGA